MKIKEWVGFDSKISTRQILAWIWNISRGIRGKAVANTVLGLAAVSLDFVFIWATKWAVDIATGKEDAQIWAALAIVVGILILGILISFSSTWINALLGVKNSNMMQIRTFSRILNSVWNGSEKRHSGDTMNRLITDSEGIVGFISSTIPEIVCTLSRLVGGFIFVFSMNSTIALVLLCIVPVFMVLSKLYIGKMRVMNREVRDTESRIQTILQESIQNRVVLKVHEQCSGAISRLADTQSDLRHKVVRKTRFSSVSNLILNSGFIAGYAFTFIWCALQLQSGAITYGMMLAFIQLVGQIQGPFGSLAAIVPKMVNTFTSAERLIELEEAPLEQSGEAIKMDGCIGLRAEHLTYCYNDADHDVISDFSFDFKPGTTTAIMGETGSGKTTFLRLVLALLSPTGGKLELYGQRGTAGVSPMTRCNLTYVPQGNTLLSGSIRSNLQLGKPDASEDEMTAALTTACADFVFEHSEGLDMVCGEEGAGISEGQAQRIAVARALLRNGSILILDEATSALDRNTEEKLLDNLAAYSKGQNKTVIVVTHRTSVLRNCDAVIDFNRL